MSSQFKKYFFSVLLIGLFCVIYWAFFSAHWGIAISKEHLWEYSFQSKSSSSFDSKTFSKTKDKKSISEKNKSQNLTFQTEFNLDDYTKILEGSLEYEYRYSIKILINGQEYADIDKTLITPSLDRDKIKIEAYWRPRKVKLNNDFLQAHLKNGKNLITLIIYNVTDIDSVDCSKKQLSFLSKGNNNQFNSNFNIEKPKSYFSESELAIFKINTNNRAIPDEPKIKASLNIFNEKMPNTLSDSSLFYDIKIERRGNTSQSFAKKSYSFNIYSDSKKKSTPLLNLPSSKKWVLQGPYADKSLIRNALTYSLYRQMGNYAPRTQFVDLIINNNYQGIYVLTEKIQISPEHLNISKLKQNELDSTKYTGGYLLEIDRSFWRSNYPPKTDTSSHPLAYMVYSPKKEKVNTALENTIRSQFNLFEQRLYENDDYYNYLDINSFIDYLIITELTKNTDGYSLSTFLYNKNINNKIPKFYIGPIWDYNFSFGLADYREGFNPEGFVYNSTKFIPFWWKKLLKDKTFKMALDKRYSELRETTLSNKNITNVIDSLSSICESSAELNFKKWTILGPSAPWPNYYAGDTYSDEIDYVKNWAEKRLVFLDDNMLTNTNKD